MALGWFCCPGQCEKLVKKDLFSPSDPILVVDIMDGRSGLFQRLGETEWIKNNANPEFQKEIEFDYVFEKKQHIRITILDVDDADKVPKEYTPNVRFRISFLNQGIKA